MQSRLTALLLLTLSPLQNALASDTSCSDADAMVAENHARQSAHTTDLLESSLIMMRALRICKKYDWWIELGRLQGAQEYWHEAADAYLKARDYHTPDADGRMPVQEIKNQALANHGLAWAFWNSGQQSSALIALEDAKQGFEVAGSTIPAELMELQGAVDDAFARSDAGLLAEAINLQRARSMRGVGVRPKPKLERQTNTLETSNHADSTISQPENIEARINLQVLFNVNSDRLLDTGLQRISEMAATIDRLNLSHNNSLLLIGHTDSTGSSQHNTDLSQRRADTVLNHLADQVKSAVKIKAIGQGESQLRYPGNSPEAHRRNRRVELILQKGS